MDLSLDERATLVRADVASWARRRWCACRISKRTVIDIVDTIDPARRPRTRVVDHVRDAARLSLELHAAIERGDDIDNHRLGRLGAVASTSLLAPLSGAMRESPVVSEVAGLVPGAAWAARDAIATALHKLDDDLALGAFGVRATFTSPVYALDYRGKSLLAGVDAPCPYRGVAELYLAGCYPMGYIDDCFVVFAP